MVDRGFGPAGPREWSPECLEIFRPYEISGADETSTTTLRSVGRDSITTAISGDGLFVAVATRSKVRVFRLEQGSTRQSPVALFRVEEVIRACTIGGGLLAIISYRSLIVYELDENTVTVHEQPLLNEYWREDDWTAKSLAVYHGRHHNAANQDNILWTWVAVGGDRSVRLFRLSKGTDWTVHQEDQPILGYNRSYGSIKSVSFSPNDSSRPFASLVTGVTDSNQILVWNLNNWTGAHQSLSPVFTTSARLEEVTSLIKSSAISDIAITPPQTIDSYGVTTATVFFSQSERPYLFCPITAARGSSPVSFTCPVGSNPQQQRQAESHREIAPRLDGRTLAGTVTPGGTFVVGIENNFMTLVPLEGIPGGVRCGTQFLRWSSNLRAGQNGNGISVRILPAAGGIRVIAVDTRGTVISKRVHVRGL